MKSAKTKGQGSCNEAREPSPPPKRQKFEGLVEIDAEPLRCSTPQPPDAMVGENGEDLDKSLEILGISHESIRGCIYTYLAVLHFLAM